MPHFVSYPRLRYASAKYHISLYFLLEEKLVAPFYVLLHCIFTFTCSNFSSDTWLTYGYHILENCGSLIIELLLASALSSLKSLSKYSHLCCHEFTCTVTDDGLQAYDISMSSLAIFACWNAADLVERKTSKLFEFYGGMPAALYCLISVYGIYPFKQAVLSATKNQLMVKLRDCWSLNKKMAA